MLRRLFGRQDEKSADDLKIEASLKKTRSGIFGQVGALFHENEIGDELWEELEEALIVADVGMETTLELVESTRARVEREAVRRADDAYLILKQEMVKLLQPDEPLGIEEPRILTVVLVVGVNGSGKTTSIGKLALRYKQLGKRVVLAAGDTFRAAAIDQLKIWGERAEVEVIAQAPGSDPAAVLFDAMRASQESRSADILIADTAGRLQNKFNLMQELEKMRRVAAKQVHRAPHEILLVLDASTGQNAILQAKGFQKASGVTGIVLTKLDSTARGGAVLNIKKQLGIPVRFVGTGEKLEDLAEFDPVAFVEGLLGE
ncbi:MAG: signal recognition particle-docking protein FtsY [Caldilineaceae bacterium]|nr:signal recognition particle-docking protein FtsY [Caldilineaceae bacterium]MCY4090056.1 signal recognition particle-docking protein FtsY [Caldilineaceae bacterium]MCY4115428.1 signal recognition particle-docking protein FtsY [Caldilineaceae bacterium]MDE0182906.1 signal recognition particle-docking protein FtsY [Caldilineaceae bacterium]